MNKEIMQKARELSEAINDVQGDIEELEDIVGYIERAGDADTPYLSTSGSGRRVFIPPGIASQWLSEEKPRLEEKLNGLEKEYEDL